MSGSMLSPHTSTMILSCVNMRSAAALDGCTRTTRRIACFQARKFSTYAYTIHHEVYCSINYKYIRIPRASERRDSIAPRPGSIERTLVFFSVLSYTKCGQCTVLDYMSTAVRIRLYARARSLVRGRTSMLQLYVQLCKFVYVGTGSKVPVPGQKYQFNQENLYKLVHM